MSNWTDCTDLCVFIHNYSHIHFICSKREVPYFFHVIVVNCVKSSIRTFHQRRSFWIIWITLCNTSNNFTPSTWADLAQCTIVLTFPKELSCKFVITIRWIFGVLYVVLKQNYKHKHTILVFGVRICYEHILKIQFKLCSVFIWEPKLFSCILFTYANKRKRRPKQRDPYQNYNQLSSLKFRLLCNENWNQTAVEHFVWAQNFKSDDSCMHINKRKYTKEKIDVALSS